MATQVFRTSIYIEKSPNQPIYTFIMKVPNVQNYEKMIAKMFGNEKDSREKRESQKSFHTTFLEKHNNECVFYEHFKEVPGYPIPKVYYMEKINEEGGSGGVIFMEDLSRTAKNQGFLQSLNEGQVNFFV